MSRIIEIFHRYEIVIEAVVALAIGLLLFYRLGTGIVLLFIATLGVTIAVNRMHRYLARKKWDDERTWIIATYAAMNALVTVAIVVLGLQLLIIARAFPDLPSSYMLGMINGILFLTFVGWNTYYYLKGYVG